MRTCCQGVKGRTSSRAACVILCLIVLRCWTRWCFGACEKLLFEELLFKNLLFEKCISKTLVVDKRWLWSARVPIVFHGEAVEENAMHVGLLRRPLRESCFVVFTI